MDFSKVAVAAISWARNPDEAQLIEDALRQISVMGIPVAVVDGGSPSNFIDRLRAIQGVSLFESREPGLQNHVVQSFEHAAAFDREFLLYSEADKAWFFQHRLAEFLKLTPDDDDLGVAIPARTPESFATFPRFQHYLETVTNVVVGEMIHQSGDYTYGPRLLRASLLPCLAGLKRDVGWGWQSYIVAVAHRLGNRIVEIPLDLPCPEEQRNEEGQEANLFRLIQHRQHLEGLTHGLTVKL